jgi:multicomponent Na+:H+ antiporter subunit F
LDTVVTVIQILLGVASILAVIRAIKGPNLADRIVALDLVLLFLAGGIAAEGARTGQATFFPVIVVVALVAAAGSLLVARFIEWRDVP